MNPSEQKKHTTVTAILRQHVNDLDAIHVAEINRLEALITAEKDAREADTDAGRKALAEEHGWILEQAEEQRTYVDRLHTDHVSTFVQFRFRGFWSRLNWLFTGR
jgi:hypothetical protein